MLIRQALRSIPLVADDPKDASKESGIRTRWNMFGPKGCGFPGMLVARNLIAMASNLRAIASNL